MWVVCAAFLSAFNEWKARAAETIAAYKAAFPTTCTASKSHKSAVSEAHPTLCGHSQANHQEYDGQYGLVVVG